MLTYLLLSGLSFGIIISSLSWSIWKSFSSWWRNEDIQNYLSSEINQVREYLQEHLTEISLLSSEIPDLTGDHRCKLLLLNEVLRHSLLQNPDLSSILAHLEISWTLIGSIEKMRESTRHNRALETGTDRVSESIREHIPLMSEHISDHAIQQVDTSNLTKVRVNHPVPLLHDDGSADFD